MHDERGDQVRVSKDFRISMSKPRKLAQVLPRAPSREDSEIPKFEVEVELDKFTKGLE